ncbi:MAG: NYN domain-containing protein, partial [Gammaproteobacteria bacterium]|nr:NYN domain-containing protein [Gammaproteobacteria bacterium]
THQVIGFIDGENLVLRFQDMCKDGAKPNAKTIHIKNTLVWHPQITEEFFCDIVRMSFYQTVVGDTDKLNQVKKQICDVKYTYSESDDIDGFGFLQPRVFKKENKAAKTKSVDINLTVDLLRHALNGPFDALMLFTGDGDYLPVVEEAARHGKQVWIGAFSKGLNADLRFVADQFIDLDKCFFEPA